MTVTLLPGDMVHDTFERYYEGIKFEDSLVMPSAEYHAMTEAQIEAMKEERFQAWVYIFTHPPEPPEPPIPEEGGVNG